MKSLESLVLVLVWTGFAVGQQPTPPPAPTPPIVDDTKKEVISPPKLEITYSSELLDKAFKANKVLVVGNLCDPIVPSGYWGAIANQPEMKKGTIFVGIPLNGRMECLTQEFSEDTSVSQIRAAVEAYKKEREVRRSPVPFRGSFMPRPGEELRPTAEGEPLAKGPWPNDLEYPQGMVRYLPAKQTQLVFNRTQVQSTPRTNLDLKWQVPGGMVGIEGWRSDLYKLIPSDPQHWRQDAQVLNSLGFFQLEQPYHRAYPPGTAFIDILSHKDRVFEGRQRKKLEDGTWESRIIYRDRQARPPGYFGLLGQQCISCHGQAGTGGYNSGFVPGGDSTLSDPNPHLER